MIELTDIKFVTTDGLYCRNLNAFEQEQLSRQIEKLFIQYNVIAFSKVVKEPQK